MTRDTRLGRVVGGLRTGVLGLREFRLLFCAQASSALGNGVSGIAIAFAVLGDHDSATSLSLVFAAGAVPQVVLLLVGGALADRVRRRQRVMLASDLARAALQAALAALVLAGPVPLWAYALQQLLWNAADAFFRPALAGLVPQTVPEARRQEANALLATTPSVGVILGAAIGGVLVAGVGAGAALALDAATFLASAAFLARMRVSADATGEPTASLLTDVREGWGAFRSRRWLVVGSVAEGFYSLLVVPAIVVLGPVLALRSLGGAAAWGIVDAAFGLGLLGGAIVMLRWRPSRLLVAAYLSLILFVPHFVLLAAVAPTWTIVVATVPAGLCASIWTTLWETAMQQEIPGELLSRVSSIAHLGFMLLFPLGYALIGPLSDLIGLSGAFLLAAACVLLNMVAVLSLPEARHMRRRPPAPAVREAAAEPAGARGA